MNRSPHRGPLLLAALTAVCSGCLVLDDTGDSGPGDFAMVDAGPADSVRPDAGSRHDLPGPGGWFHVGVTEYVVAQTGEGFALAQAGGWEYVDAEETLFEVARVGDCAYLEPQLAQLCDPQCQFFEVCQRDGTCKRPEDLVAGVITVSGLTVGLDVVPEPPYDNYLGYFDPEPVAGNLFGGGDSITATAAGGAVPPFALSATGVAAVETTLTCSLALAGDVDFTVTWTAGGGDDQIRFVLEGGNHAAQFPHIVCSAADTGVLIVDGSLLTRYLSNPRPGGDVWSLSRVSAATSRVGEVDVRFEVAHRTGCRF